MTPLLLAAAALGTDLAPPPRPVALAAVPDRVDVVFLAAARPVRAVVTVTHGGRPLAERWDAHVRRLFAAWDRDRDGTLDAEELDGGYPVVGVREMFAGGVYYRVSAQPPEVAEVDRDGDKRVSLNELRAYYAPVAGETLRTRSLTVAGGPAGVTEELFARIDRNRDGKLTQAEVKDAERILAKLDRNDDECVAVNEVLNSRTPTEAVMSTADAAMMMTGPAKDKPADTVTSDLLVYQTGLPASLLTQVMKRYDRNGDGVLTAAEIGFDPATFARLDADRNSRLTAKELEAWRTGEPDAVVALDAADTPAATTATAARPDRGAWPAGLSVRQTEPGRVVLRVGTQTAEFGIFTPAEPVRARVNRQFLDGVYPSGKASVTEKDIAGPQFQLLRVVFDSADADANGTLTRAEFEAYFALQRATTDAALVLTFATRTPNLFQMLDDNVDGKLSVRELRTAWDRLIVLEPGDAGAVTTAVLQPSATLRLMPAAFAAGDAQTAGDGPKPPAVGPLWLRKMDRNSDGDLSPAEFLGDAATFDRLDANRDRLISTAEAVEYEKQARPAKTPKAGAK